MKNYNITTAIVALSLAGVGSTTVAHADFTQSFGISTKCLANAGACVASSSDYASFYHNPAGAASFDTTVIGGGLQLLDTRGLRFSDGTDTFGAVDTNVDGVIAGLPSFGFYKPVTDKLVLGVGLGVPFGITADWDNQSFFQTNVQDQSLVSVDLSPTISYNVNDKLRIGGALNIAIARQFGVGINAGAAGVLGFTTDNELDLEGLPPGGFDFGLHAVSFTAGLQYDVNDRLTLGLSGRTRQRQKYEGTYTQTVGGTVVDSTGFSTNIDGPAHIQAGLHFKAIPQKLDVSLDFQRTFWSSARFFGEEFRVDFDQPILGAFSNIRVNYNANDANAYRLGLTYHAKPGLALRAGYAYEETGFPEANADLLTFSSDRQHFTVGLSYDTRKGNDKEAGWELDGAFQWTRYNEQNIPAGGSTNAGGLATAALVPPTATFGPNPAPVSFSGNLYLFSLGASYNF